jgi:hypothetical protein
MMNTVGVGKQRGTDEEWIVLGPMQEQFALQSEVINLVQMYLDTVM